MLCRFIITSNNFTMMAGIKSVFNNNVADVSNCFIYYPFHLPKIAQWWNRDDLFCKIRTIVLEFYSLYFDTSQTGTVPKSHIMFLYLSATFDKVRFCTTVLTALYKVMKTLYHLVIILINKNVMWSSPTSWFESLIGLIYVSFISIK